MIYLVPGYAAAAEYKADAVAWRPSFRSSSSWQTFISVGCVRCVRPYGAGITFVSLENQMLPSLYSGVAWNLTQHRAFKTLYDLLSTRTTIRSLLCAKNILRATSKLLTSSVCLVLLKLASHLAIASARSRQAQRAPLCGLRLRNTLNRSRGTRV